MKHLAGLRTTLVAEHGDAFTKVTVVGHINNHFVVGVRTDELGVQEVLVLPIRK